MYNKKLRFNKKKAQGNIFLSIFFIAIVLIIIFIFTRYHEAILIGNYNVNEQKLHLNTIYSLNERLIQCYGFPISVDEDESCKILDNFNYDLKLHKNGLCDEEYVLEVGKKTNKYVTLIVPVAINLSQFTCPATLSLYFE